MATMHLDIVSAEEKLFSGVVKEVSVPGKVGSLGIYPKHTQLISPIRHGELSYQTEDGETASMFIAGGIVEVQPDVVTVLADTAVRAEDLDEEKAQSAIQRAEDALEGKDPEDLDYEAVQTELEAAKAQMEMFHRVGKARRGR